MRDQRRHSLPGDVTDVGRSCLQLADAAGVEVDPDHREPGFGERDGQGETGVAETDQTDDRLTGGDAAP